MWFVDRKFFGTRKHLLVDGAEVSWVDDVPYGILDYASCEHDSLLNFLAVLDDVEIPELLPENIRETLEITGIPRSCSGAGFLLRAKELHGLIHSFVSKIAPLVEILEPYQKTYFRNAKVLSKCQDALYSPARLKVVDTMQKITLNRDGFASHPVYNIGKGKTGRMSVVKGSQILTCPREVKECIRSRFEGGKIVEIDFSSLEPRTALAVMGSSLAESPDIYSHVGDLFSPPLSREKAKQVTISFLYGAAKSTIQNLIGRPDKIETQLAALHKMFGFNEVVDNAAGQVVEFGFFRNHAGRPIYPQSSKKGLLFNNYCQSSAVDVALSGFSYLLEYVEQNTRAVPLYFIHDAIILDVPPDDYDKIEKESKFLPTYLGINFPTKIKTLHN